MGWLSWIGAVWLAFLVGFVLGAGWSGLLNREKRFELTLRDRG
jgi:hypothetical protein